MTDPLFGDSIELCPSCRQPVAVNPQLMPEDMPEDSGLRCPYCGVDMNQAREAKLRHKQYQNFIP